MLLIEFNFYGVIRGAPCLNVPAFVQNVLNLFIFFPLINIINTYFVKHIKRDMVPHIITSIDKHGKK